MSDIDVNWDALLVEVQRRGRGLIRRYQYFTCSMPHCHARVCLPDEKLVFDDPAYDLPEALDRGVPPGWREIFAADAAGSEVKWAIYVCDRHTDEETLKFAETFVDAMNEASDEDDDDDGGGVEWVEV